VGKAITGAITRCFGQSDPSSSTYLSETFDQNVGPTSGRLIREGDPHEHVNFLTDFIRAIWPEINASISKLIRETCERVFSTISSPKLQVNKMELGTVPIILDNIHISRIRNNIRTTDQETGACVRLIMDAVWNGNCDIEFETSLRVRFGIERLKFKGRLVCVIFPLARVPLIGAIQYSFINPPQIDLTFTGIASIAQEFKLLRKIIQSAIESAVSRFVLPKKNLHKIDPTLSLVDDIYQPPLGILRLTVLHGNGFVIQKKKLRRPDIPDVYCLIRMGGGADTTPYTTSVIKDSTCPMWNESFDIVLHDMDQVLSIHAWDRDTGALDPDDDLGLASITVQDLLLTASYRTNGARSLELQTAAHHPTGACITVTCQLLKLVQDTDNMIQTLSPILETIPVANRAKTKSNSPKGHQLYGLVTVLIQGASNLPRTKNNQKPCSFVMVRMVNPDGGSCSVEIKSKTVINRPRVDALQPVYDAIMDIPLTMELIGHDVVLELWTRPTLKDVLGQSLLGSITVPFQSLLSGGIFRAEQHPIGSQGTTLEFSIMLHSVLPPLVPSVSSPVPVGGIPAIPTSPNKVTPEITRENGGPMNNDDLGPEMMIPRHEKVMIHVLSGHGFPMQKQRRRGRGLPGVFRPEKEDIPNIYFRIRCGSNPFVWRTPTIPNSTDPIVWEDCSYEFVLPPGLSSHAQTIDIRAFDQQDNRRKNRGGGRGRGRGRGIRRDHEDDPEGQARVSVRTFLLHGRSSQDGSGREGATLEVELYDDVTGKALSRYVTLLCQVTTSA